MDNKMLGIYARNTIQQEKKKEESALSATAWVTIKNTTLSGRNQARDYVLYGSL